MMYYEKVKWGEPLTPTQVEMMKGGMIITVTQFGHTVCKIMMCPNGSIQEIN